MKREPKPIEDRFFQKVVETPAGCWEWTGTLTKHGYGQISFGTRVTRKVFLAHRWAYEYIVGLVPGGLVLDHLCRNRKCVNPKHLEPVTNRENLLRGDGWSGSNARKTHCPRGHELAGSNLSGYHLARGQRKCLRCHADRQRAHKRRLREQRSDATQAQEKP